MPALGHRVLGAGGGWPPCGKSLTTRGSALCSPEPHSLPAADPKGVGETHPLRAALLPGDGQSCPHPAVPDPSLKLLIPLQCLPRAIVPAWLLLQHRCPSESFPGPDTSSHAALAPGFPDAPTELYSPTVLEAGSQKARCGQGWFPMKALEEAPASPSFWWLQTFSGCSGIVPVSALWSHGLLTCLLVCVSYEDIDPWR